MYREAVSLLQSYQGERDERRGCEATQLTQQASSSTVMCSKFAALWSSIKSIKANEILLWYMFISLGGTTATEPNYPPLILQTVRRKSGIKGFGRQNITKEAMECNTRITGCYWMRGTPQWGAPRVLLL